MLLAIFLIIFFLYPIWGFAMMLSLCLRKRAIGSLTKRIKVAIAVASFATVVFTPVMWGGEGFAMMVPWYLARLFDPMHMIFLWPLAAFVFSAAILITLLPRKHPES